MARWSDRQLASAATAALLFADGPGLPRFERLEPRGSTAAVEGAVLFYCLARAVRGGIFDVREGARGISGPIGADFGSGTCAVSSDEAPGQPIELRNADAGKSNDSLANVWTLNILETEKRGA